LLLFLVLSGLRIHYYCEIEWVLLSKREVLSVEPSGIVRSSAGCKDKSCSWVHRRGRDREEKKEDILSETTNKNCMIDLNIL
jgi:hypothetical protein